MIKRIICFLFHRKDWDTDETIIRHYYTLKILRCGYCGMYHTKTEWDFKNL